MSFTAQQDETITQISQTCSALSLAGSFFIIFSFLRFKDLRKFAYSLIFALTVSDLIRSIAKMCGSLPNGTIGCTAQAFIMTFGGLSSFLFIAVIAYVMYSLIYANPGRWQLKPKELRHRFYYIAISVYSIALVFTSLPLVTNSYGNVGGWCWIIAPGDTYNIHHVWRIVCFYGWLMLAILFSLCIYVKLVSYLLKVDRQVPQSNQKFQTYRKLRYYPLILIVCFSFSIYRRFAQIFVLETAFWVACCQAFFAGMYGFTNAVVYGINPRLKRLYQQWFSNMLTAVKKRVNAGRTTVVKEQGNEHETKPISPPTQMMAAMTATAATATTDTTAGSTDMTLDDTESAFAFNMSALATNTTADRCGAYDGDDDGGISVRVNLPRNPPQMLVVPSVSSSGAALGSDRTITAISSTIPTVTETEAMDQLFVFELKRTLSTGSTQL